MKAQQHVGSLAGRPILSYADHARDCQARSQMARIITRTAPRPIPISTAGRCLGRVAPLKSWAVNSDGRSQAFLKYCRAGSSINLCTQYANSSDKAVRPSIRARDDVGDNSASEIDILAKN